jgi:hypothetical protein
VSEWKLVPVEPTPEHIDSIAMRYYHGFGLLPSEQQNNVRAFARQMYEECTGQGFYQITPPPAADAVTNELVLAARAALSYMESVGESDMYPEEWRDALRLRAAIAAFASPNEQPHQPTNQAKER